MKIKKKCLAILGSTGSIGTQTLDIISKFSELFCVHVLSANSNHLLLFEQAKKISPKHIIINTDEGYIFLKKNLNKTVTRVWKGEGALCELISEKVVDLVVTAVVGSSGLKPTISAILAKKDIALANKETLVVGGKIIMELSKKNNTQIIPIDSEHSAIYQCLLGEEKVGIKKLILTASGGPFLKLPKRKFLNITIQQALNHPNWTMGSKITVDSATLMNKGLEIIEARWLFDINFEKIDVIIHPESIIHSMVEFNDGSVKAQLGNPKMSIPILYALSHPKRNKYDGDILNLHEVGSLNFLKPDFEKFPHLKLAYEIGKVGGSAPCVLNAANEIAVEAFLEKKIKFTDMIKILKKSLENFTFVKNPDLNDLIDIDEETRRVTKKIIKTL